MGEAEVHDGDAEVGADAVEHDVVGLMSRWMIPAVWMAVMPRRPGGDGDGFFGGEGLRLLRRALRVSPVSSFMVKKRKRGAGCWWWKMS